jgi:hypothetical protein
VKRVVQLQYSCGAPLSRELTREKHERLFVALTPAVAAVSLAGFPGFPQARYWTASESAANSPGSTSVSDFSIVAFAYEARPHPFLYYQARVPTTAQRLPNTNSGLFK